MGAVVLRRFGEPEELSLGTMPAPDVGDEELLVRVRACGVCGHDVLARRGKLGGPLPRVLGHEIAGAVERVGVAVERFTPGDRVVLNQRRSCGRCRACRAGQPNHCTSGPGFYGEDLPGGYAQYVVAGPENAVRLPNQIDDVTAAALPCGVVTALHALARAEVSLGETVAVVGAGGGVGVHAILLARLSGARVVAVTHRAEKVARLEALKPDLVVAAEAAELAAAVRSAAGGPVDVVIDCAGVTLPASLRMLRHGGRLALLGNVDPRLLELQAGLLILKEIALLGSSHGTPAELATAVELVRAGRLAPVVDAVLPLDQAAEAHRRLGSGQTVGRVILSVD
jgi:D-arabinose 1-dehydrogenase-like Zn-dependent alcohol dehydrogenase